MNRNELYKRVTYKYLGYTDEQELEDKEKEYELKIREELVREEANKRLKIDVD